MHAVVLGAPRRDDDDRRADPLRARRLDQLPAVELRQHQVEHADVRVLEAQPRQPELAAPDHDRVEPGRREMPRHAVGDHVVVLDDQDLAHAPTIVPWLVRTRLQTGDDLVKAPFRRKDEPAQAEPVEEMPVTLAATSVDEQVEDVSFDALRTGFTASVSHELRTPLARILVLLDSADLPGADVDGPARAGAGGGAQRRRR